MTGQYCIYLRKSRADAEAEQRGEGETLARHETALLELANRLKLHVAAIYREVASGESIAARPAAQRLLSEVEQGLWSGVLVMEVERLARGDTIDQGLVAQAFRYSGTRIVTPLKAYDPSDEFDEEYFEFGLFMSRREYKAINRRLQRGRLASVMEGKYVANRAPYGYNRVKIPDGKGFTLEIDHERAEVIQLIYSLFVHGEPQENGGVRQMGACLIARRLNELNIPSSTGNGWTPPTVRDILKSPVYIGKIRWNWRRSVKQVVDGRRVTKRPRQSPEDCCLVDGLHEAIVPAGLWHETQRIMSSRVSPPIPSGRVTQNPLCGLVVCGKCGRKMQRRPGAGGRTPPALICEAEGCGNISAYLHLVEGKVLAALDIWLGGYEIGLQDGEPPPDILLRTAEKSVRSLEEATVNTKKQMDNLHDLLEQGVYDAETFLARSELLAGRMAENAALLERARAGLRAEELRGHVEYGTTPKTVKLLEVYDSLETPLQKNRILKELLDKVVYIKETGGRWHADYDEFTIMLYPKVCGSEYLRFT